MDSFSNSDTNTFVFSTTWLSTAWLATAWLNKDEDMLEDYVCVKREFFIENTLNAETFKVFMFLAARQQMQKGVKLGLSVSELARLCDLGTTTVKQALKTLVTDGLIVMQEKGKNFIITLNSYYTDESIPIPFTYQNTDENKLQTVETELRRLQLQQTHDKLGRESGIAAKLSDDKRDVVTTIERDLGRALTTEEAFIIGQLLGGFDPTRVKVTWQRKAATAKNPIRALHAMMWNGVAGKPMPQKILIDAPTVRDL